MNTTAVKIANADGSIVPQFSIPDGNGGFTNTQNVYLVVNGNTGTLASSGNDNQLLFGSGNTPNSVKLYDAIDRLTLHAKWQANDSQISIVYWTENEQLQGYQAPQNEKDDYSASGLKVIKTQDLNLQSATIGKEFYSGSTITLNDLKKYKIDNVSVLNEAFLDEASVVEAGEEKFYELKESLSDASVVINGDGSTTINVYFSRRTFKIVFHIGRDGYVKNGGNQKPNATTAEWLADPNWIEYMFKDSKVTELLGREGKGSPSTHEFHSMTYQGVTYDNNYVTTVDSIKSSYIPDPATNPEDSNLYVIEAKYGAYIGDRWPTPVNPAFTFTDQPGARYTMYIWAGYYDSLYCRIANERSTAGNAMGANPDINGVYEYMSAELCSDRSGDNLIGNQVHHLVAYYGTKGKQGIIKNYHFLYEAIDGT